MDKSDPIETNNVPQIMLKNSSKDADQKTGNFKINLSRHL